MERVLFSVFFVFFFLFPHSLSAQEGEGGELGFIKHYPGLFTHTCKDFFGDVNWISDDILERWFGDVLFHNACNDLASCYAHGWQYGWTVDICNDRFLNQMASVCEDADELGSTPASFTLKLIGLVGTVQLFQKTLTIVSSNLSKLPPKLLERFPEAVAAGSSFARVIESLNVSKLDCQAWSLIFYEKALEELDGRFHTSPWTGAGTLTNPSLHPNDYLPCTGKVKTVSDWVLPNGELGAYRWAPDLYWGSRGNTLNDRYCFLGFEFEIFMSSGRWEPIRPYTEEGHVPWDGIAGVLFMQVNDEIDIRVRPSRWAGSVSAHFPRSNKDIFFTFLGNTKWSWSSSDYHPVDGYEWRYFSVRGEDYNAKVSGRSKPEVQRKYKIKVKNANGDYDSFNSGPEHGLILEVRDPDWDKNCDSRVIAGGLQAESHIISLGKASGKVKLVVQTYDVEDVVVLEYEGRERRSLGCIGTEKMTRGHHGAWYCEGGGTCSTNLIYNGDSSHMTVTVFPNCLDRTDGKGTEWWFELECPD